MAKRFDLCSVGSIARTTGAAQESNRREGSPRAPSAYERCSLVGMRGRGLSLGAIYLIVGLVVAVLKDYFDNIETFKGVLEALIAIIIWPAVLLGVDINVR